ncbi:MAG: putative holin-like toxin [Lachnospiraceae bacterium]
MPMYVTYSDLIQIGIFIVALVGLCYKIFKGKRK